MSSGLVELLGDKLLSGTQEVATGDALAGKGAVAIYFSAHWCPPCRGFTPQLAKWYNDSLKEKGLEVVFVSSDKSDDAFKEYYAEMPWKALPYSDRDKKDALSKKFKVQGIPSLVILDTEGKVITDEGREAVSKDPTGENFPWRPKSFKEVWAGVKIMGKEGPVDASTLDGKVFALYFSAHWCPPCRGFTPQLAEWYTKSLKEKGLEVVFVSSDKTEEEFNSYYKEQPWLALDYSQRKEKEELSSLFKVRGIPSLVIIDKDGSIITKEGRAAVSCDPEGADFPWYPKPVKDLAGGPGFLNSAACVVAFCEASDDPDKKASEEAMESLAKSYLDKAKAAGEEEPEVSFMIAKSAGNIAEQLRKMMGLPALPPAGSVMQPKLMLINIPDDGAFFDGPEGPLTAGAVEKFVADFTAGSLQRKQLEK